MKQNQTFIIYAQRTAIGKLSGAFASVPAPRLAAPLIQHGITQLGIKPEHVDEIIMGNVLTAGVGQAPARQAAIYGGLPHSVCATTINRVCGSGLKSVMLADQGIRLGDGQLYFAGGMENMTLAPHLLPQSRAGYKFGSIEIKDHMQLDGLWDPYNQVAMGQCGDICAKEYGFTREIQDAYALESYQRARQAQSSGAFKQEIIPVQVPQKSGAVAVDTDEEPGSVDLNKLPQLRAAFAKDGTVTAGNASSINDGAAVLILASEEYCKKNSIKPLARIVSQASHAQEPTWFTTAPIGSIQKALAKAGWNSNQVDLYEINEAFAVVPLAAMKDLNLPREKVNVDGGAVALGHPIGASGARVLVTLIHGLKRRGLRKGLASLCIGGGEASAVAIELI